MRKNLLLATSCAVIAFEASSAGAQSIDYGAMEELFGEPVTTSATGKPQRLSEVPLTMEILTQEDIRRSGAINIAEVLRQVNGVNVVQKTTSEWDVSIRGYNQHHSQRLLVLVNGRQVYLDHYGYTSWESIPVRLEEIQQIEVVKGPNTALFGFNAVNGVINIVTYNPLYDDVSSAGITIGSNDYREGHYVQSMRINDKFATRISASSKNADNFENNINTAASVSGSATDAGFVDPQRETLNVDTMFQVTDRSQLRVELSGSNTKEPGIASTGHLFNFDYENKSAKVSYENDSDYGLIKANIYKNYLDWKGVSSASNSLLDNEVLVAQLEDTVELTPKHTVRLQGEYRANELTGQSLVASDAEVSYEVYAAGAMSSWRINDEFSWTNAARVDHLRLDHEGSFLGSNPYTDSDYNKDITEYSYNSGLLWTPTEKDTVRLSTARGLEIPSLLEYGIDTTFGPLSLVGNPDLDPAVVTNYELAWDRKVDQIDGMFRSAIFYNKTKDIKSMNGVLNGLIYSSANIGESKSHGIELELSGKFNEYTDWEVGYVYQRIKDDLNNGKTATTLSVAKEYEDSNPEHQINASLGYKKGPWEADSLVYYVSETDQYGTTGATASLEKIDSYVGMNARVGYTFEDDLTLAVHGQQLLSSEVQTSSTPDIDRRVFLSLTKKF